MELPPGQRAVLGFPRFGVDRTSPPPAVPENMVIEITGPLSRRVAFAPGGPAELPRRSVVAALHCVAGWSATGLRWQGVRFGDVYRELVEPALLTTARVRYVVFVGLDGYRSIVLLDDVLGADVLIADSLDGQPLTGEHGAPVRLISPAQYGFVSTKHLCRIELYGAEPVGYYHPNRRAQLALRVVRPHRRARVAYEERHRHLPGRLARRIYRRLVEPPAPLAPRSP